MKLLMDLAQLFIIYWVICKVLKYTVFKRFNKFSKRGKYGKNRLSLLEKILVLISRQLHSSLDGLLRKQSIHLREKKNERQQCKRQQNKSLEKQDAQQDSKENKNNNEKVIEFKKYQSKGVR